jgi:hypothetical protein
MQTRQPLIELLKPLSALTRQDFTWPASATRREIKRCHDQYSRRRNQITDCYDELDAHLHDEMFKAAQAAGLLLNGEMYMDLCYNALLSCHNDRPWRDIDCRTIARIRCYETIRHIANDILRNWRKRNSPQYFYHFGGPGVVIQEAK